MNGLNMWSLSFFILLISIWDLSVSKKICSENVLEKREEIANIVISGTVKQLMPDKIHKNMYKGEIEIKRIFKGNGEIHNRTYNVIKRGPNGRSMVMIEGFGDPHICESVVRKFDTRIFLLNKGENGDLKLNSSIVRLTLTNLERTYAAVEDMPFTPPEIKPVSPCRSYYCAFSAMCLVNKTSGKPYCQCITNCPSSKDLVCGNDDFTYDSVCHMKQASCREQRRIRVQHKGKCEKGRVNPCDGAKCNFGAKCVPTKDGTMHRCECPARCDNYGDTIDSMPVCGSDHVEYANRCELRRASCKEMTEINIKFFGKCDPCAEHQCEDPYVCLLDNNRVPVCKCQEKCEDTVNMVCGDDGRTYSNECRLRMEACKTQRKIHIFQRGKCRGNGNIGVQEDPGAIGNNPCTRITCEYGKQCKIDRQGHASCECPPPCPLFLRPVCGTNGKTYDNECELERQACELQQNVQLNHRGRCGGSDKCRNVVCHYGAQCVVKAGRAQCECPSCSEEFREVCGSDGITYSNECKMRREGCRKRLDIIKDHNGNCNGCGEYEKCEFYSKCDATQNACACPTCVDTKEARVCGSDGVTYQNECYLRQWSCKKQEYIIVMSLGQCELCDRNKPCLNGARCENGKCVCPVVCSDIFNPVCASDDVTYSNECEMKKRACVKNIVLDKVHDGQCVGSSGESGDGPSGEVDLLSDCDENLNCRYNGECLQEYSGAFRCVCNFNCEAVRSSVCGSDGKTYGNECQMREEACRQQREINEIPMDNCDDITEEACDGFPPVTSHLTGLEYDCSRDSNVCPPRSYCHKVYGKCCQEGIESDNIKGCQATKYGCCPDGVTASPDLNKRGCPEYCRCNPVGSLAFTCDPNTKTCTCKPGVGGKNCDRCIPGYWGLEKIQYEGNQGCLACGCHHLGSTRDDCEQMEGNCNCKPGVKGRKCDTCPDGTYIDDTGCNGILAEGKSCREIVCAFYGVCVESNGYASCSCNLPCVMHNNQNSVSVCGSDGNTYPNECRLRVDSCSRRVNITVAYTGICYGGTSAHPATSMPLTERSRKTTRHINSGISSSRVTNVQMLFSTVRPRDKVPSQANGRIWGLCFGNNFCNVPNSECRTGVCRCKKGFIPTLENTHCSEVITEEVVSESNAHDDTNPCTANPCKNNGTCDLDDSLGYRCLCALGWTGPICREAMSYRIPSFSGKSYLALAEVLKPDNDITIEIGFQTYSHDGILFYSSQYRNGSGDFISITLKNGHLEFRYDLGSGIAVLNSQDVLNLNQPYQIIVNRMGREGMLEVKGGGVVKGSSPPSLTSLNLKGPMYLGYIPDFVEVATDRMEVYLGFVGCITSFKAGTTDSEHVYNLSFPQDSAVSRDIQGGQDIGTCGNNPCRSLPCQNGGSCQMLYADSFHCTCSAGFSGKLCDEAMHPCAESPCKDGASCQLTETGGYKCVCPDDREGEYCEYERLQKVFIPEFLGTSMIQLPLEDASIASLTIKIWFKTYKSNGVLLYASQFANGIGDFISLNIIENSLEYRFDVGAGTVIIRSNRDIQIDHWHEVMIQKIGTHGTLLIDNDDKKRYTGESQGILTELNLQYGFLYLGGFKNRFTIPRDSDVTTNFTGVIQKIYINTDHIDNIMERSTAAHNIIEYIGPPCNVNPCLNGGVCYPRLNEVDCKCPKKFLGQMCEKRAENLMQDSPILFDGSTHLQYANEITTEQRSQRINRYNIKFKTSQHSGLILYQNGQSALLGDYLALAIVNGKVEFSYNLGKQTEDDLHIIRSAVRVDDGQWHRLLAYREEREGSLQVDSEAPVVDTSNAGATQLDTNGELWIGGKVDLPLGLPLDYRQGFTGCISEVYINDRQLHLLDHRNEHSTHIMRFCK